MSAVAQVARIVPKGVTPSGLALAFTVALVAGSGFPELRPQIAGFLFHPYLLALALLTPVTLLRLHRFARGPTVFGGLFLVSASVVIILEGRMPGEVAKLTISGLTILAIAVNVRNEADFRLCVLLLPLAVCVIALGTLIRGDESLGAISGARFMRGVGNKNAFSLYALPAILIAGYLFTDRLVPRFARTLMGVAALFLTGSLFLSANRSGWLGVFVIAAMLALVRLNARTALLVAAGSIVIGLLATRSEASDMIELRVEQTRGDYSSDRLRWNLFVDAVEIGMDRPLLGAGPDHLMQELARRERVLAPALDPHNVFGYLIGGYGLPTTVLYLGFLGALVFLGGARSRQSRRQREAGDLVRMVVVLFVVRGIFTREVLYMPAMAIALGLALGLYTVRRIERAEAARGISRDPARPIRGVGRQPSRMLPKHGDAVAVAQA